MGHRVDVGLARRFDQLGFDQAALDLTQSAGTDAVYLHKPVLVI